MPHRARQAMTPSSTCDRVSVASTPRRYVLLRLDATEDVICRSTTRCLPLALRSPVVRVHVDQQKCQGHNRCAVLAPDLFEVDEMGMASVKGDGVVPPADDETKAPVGKLWVALSSDSGEARRRAHNELLRRRGDALLESGRRLRGAKPDDPAAVHLVWLAAADAEDPTTELAATVRSHPRAEVRLQAVPGKDPLVLGEPNRGARRRHPRVSDSNRLRAGRRDNQKQS